MANIKGLQLKAIKKTLGKEGYGMTANIYLNNRKVGTYADWGNGGAGEADYVSKEAAAAVRHILFAYGNEHPDPFMLKVYTHDKKRYEEEAEHIRKIYPDLDGSEITPASVSSHDIDHLVFGLMRLIEWEKQFKAGIKKGYKYLGVKTGDHMSDDMMCWFGPSYSKKRIEDEGYRAFSSMEDFIVG